MKLRLTVLTLIVLLVSVGAVFAAEDVVNVGNKSCPISGEKVGMMGPAVPLEYKGKVYNLCCAGCVSTFKYDPEKHVKVVEEEMGIHKE